MMEPNDPDGGGIANQQMSKIAKQEKRILEMDPEAIKSLQLCFERPIYDMDKVRDWASNAESTTPEAERELSKLRRELTLIKISTVSYRDRRDIRKSLAQFYGVMHAMRVRFLYIIKGDKEGVDFYIGVAGEDGAQSSIEMSPDDMTHSLLGVMPGCQAVPINSAKDKNKLLGDVMRKYSYSYIVTGIPTCQVSFEKREQYQEEEKARTGIERLIDSVSGEDFVLSILCTPLENTELATYRQNVADMVDFVKPLAKRQETQGVAENKGNSEATTDTESTSTSQSETSSTGRSTPEKEGHVGRRIMQNLKAFSKGGKLVYITRNEQESITTGQQKTWSRGETKTETFSETKSLGISRERTSMEMTALSIQLEKLHKRLLDAGGEGMWKTCIMFHAEKEIVLKRAAFAATAIWQGADSAVDPIRCLRITKSGDAIATQPSLMNLNFTDEKGDPIQPFFGKSYSNLYTCLTHKELAHIADFPHWDLPGVTVRPLVEYARISPKAQGSYVELGGLIDRATINHDICEHSVHLSYDQLNKHCFVSGVTGSGKSTTMRKLLKELAGKQDEDMRIPFMVIEPAKREYRELGERGVEGLTVYSLGRPECDFALNPFSFGKGTQLFSHLDFLKSTFNALLGSYSSMPFILETILCKCYEKAGWDLETGENSELERELGKLLNRTPETEVALREKYMPTIGEMAGLVDEVLNDYFGADKSDYRISLRGALKARLNSLTSSLKGRLLNRREEESFELLLNKNVVFELEAFSDNEEKAFIMALLLGRIYEIRQVEAQQGRIEKQGLRHVVVLEEAHRLLTKTEGKGELQANPRAKAVETFSDMLAEVRSYGQGLVIVDQIPSKLTPEVMKNTEVKIVHRLLSKDDREAVGATMNLTKEQIEDLARHNPGEATMYFGELTNALHVKIQP